MTLRPPVRQRVSRITAITGCAGALAMAVQAGLPWEDGIDESLNPNWTVYTNVGTVVQTNGQLVLKEENGPRYTQERQATVDYSENTPILESGLRGPVRPLHETVVSQP